MKKLLFLLLTGICTLTSKAQHSYMSAPGVGVFYPPSMMRRHMRRLPSSNRNFIS